LAECKNDGVGLKRLELAGRPGLAFVVDLHYFDRQIGPVDFLDRPQPVNFDPFGHGFISFKLMRRHVLPIAAIHDERLRRAQPFRGPGGVHRRVAAAVDHDSASQHGLAAGSHVAQQRYRIEDLGGVARRYVDMLCEMRADRHKNGVELTRRFGFQHIFDFTIENDLDAEVFDSFDLGHEIGARKPVRGDAEMQHPAGQRTSVVDFDVVTEAPEMIRCRQPPRAGAYNQDALS
jgi:hypothetical protein